MSVSISPSALGDGSAYVALPDLGASLQGLTPVQQIIARAEILARYNAAQWARSIARIDFQDQQVLQATQREEAAYDRGRTARHAHTFDIFGDREGEPTQVKQTRIVRPAEAQRSEAQQKSILDQIYATGAAIVGGVVGAIESVEKAVEGTVTTVIDEVEALGKGFWSFSQSFTMGANSLLGGSVGAYKIEQPKVSYSIGASSAQNPNAQAFSVAGKALTTSSLAAPIVLPSADIIVVDFRSQSRAMTTSHGQAVRAAMLHSYRSPIAELRFAA